MPTIFVLNEGTAGRIAAGEVIERPVSIVKELVENSLDAGADTITVSVTDGGLQEITVTDNGCGMSSEDVPLAFYRHATSKIKSDADLSYIASLGFRGEALPSIAAISFLTIKTKRAADNQGYMTIYRGGLTEEKGPVGCPNGTTIEVQDIFYNTPARRKHLKSKSTESGLISDLIYRMALLRPQIKFCLINNGRDVFRSPGSGKIMDALIAVYGMREAQLMLPVKGESLVGEGQFSVQGYISKPELSRSTRQQITIGINGRLVRSAAVNNSLEKAYLGKLTSGRYPVAVLKIQLPPEQMDVNVHPHKQEVKLLHEEQVKEVISFAVGNALKETRLIKSAVNLPKSSEPYQLAWPTVYDDPPHEHLPERTPWPEKVIQLEQTDDKKPDIFAEAKENYTGDMAEKHDFPDLFVIGQLMNAYLLTQSEDGFFVIDQHAAHERVLFEMYRQRLNDSQPETQYLLAPMNINLKASAKELLWEYESLLQSFGYVFENFGGAGILLRGIPTDSDPGQSEAVLIDIVDSVLAGGKADQEKRKYNLAALLSCKAAVKAGERMPIDTIIALIKRLSKAEEPYTCPHGRPTIISFSRRELDVLFKRT